MAERSAGVMLVRFRDAAPEVLIAHMGGPYFRRKDAGAWTIPKGHIERGESEAEAARRELREETGIALPDDAALFELGTIKLRSGKVVFGFAVVHDVDETRCVSETVEMEWPPRSGRMIKAPELDQFRWCGPDEARALLHPAQVPFVDRALAAVTA